MERVILNLLSNSIKFNPIHGKIKIKLHKNNYAEFCIEDNGPGIPSQFKEAILNVSSKWKKACIIQQVLV